MMTHQWVFDIRPDDVYWCTADCGWVTGHSYIVYGPLANHTTGVIYEGTPEHPSWSRHWEIVQRHKVTIYYTAPTAIRALVGAGDEHVESTTCPACACSARSASRSTPRRGCGTTSASAAAAARSSTPGGRPRRARS